MKILPKDEFEKLVYEQEISEGATPEEATFQAMTTEGLAFTKTGELVVSQRSSTRKKLHEIGHKRLGVHKIITGTEKRTVGDVAYDEILAEKFAWESKGKGITPRVGLPAILTLNYEEKLSPKESVNVVIEVLEKYVGIPVTKGDRKFMVNWIKRYKRVV